MGDGDTRDDMVVLVVADLNDDRSFAANLFGVFVSPQSLKRRMANLAVARPLRELDFADQVRFHPMRVAPQRSRGRRRKRRGLLLDALEARAQLEREFVRESGSHFAG